MDLDRPPGGRPELTRLGAHVSPGQAGPWCRIRGLLGACLLVAAAAGPAALSGTVSQSARPATGAPYARLTAAVRAAAPQTITFGQPQGTSAGVPVTTVGALVTLAASASSALPVSFRSDTPLVCTVSGTIVTAVAAGGCTVTASQAGNAEFADAPSVAQAIQIGTGTGVRTVTFGQPAGTQPGQPATMVGAHVILSASVPETQGAAPEPGQVILFQSDTPAVCTVSGTTTSLTPAGLTTTGSATAVAAGACTITATQPGDASFAAAGAARTFQVGTGTDPQRVSFTQPPGAQAGARVALSARTSSRLPVTFRSDTPAVCTVAGRTTTGHTTTGAPATAGWATAVGAGACTITATQPGDASFAAAGAARAFQVGTGPKPQAIMFRRPRGTRAGVTAGTPVALSASASSRLTVSFRSDTPLVCAISRSTLLTLAAGRCTITATQAGSAQFAAAREEHRSFTVGNGQRSQLISLPGEKTPPTPMPADVPVGVAGYLPATATSRLAVTLSAATGTGAQVPPACAVSGMTVITLAAGSCVITAGQGGSEVFAPATRQFPVVVVSRGMQSQSITGFSVPPRGLVGVPFVVSAQADSGLAVSFRTGSGRVTGRSGTSPVCTVSGATVILLTAGTCTLTAFQAGSSQSGGLQTNQHNGGYQAAAPATRSIQVQDTQAITFVPPPSARAGVAVPLTATASSGLPVAFRSDTPAVCTVSGTTVTTLAPGPCTITATQAGDTGYAAAPDVTRTFQVQATQTITFTQPKDAAARTQVSLAAKASSGLPVAFNSDTPAACSVSGATVTTLAAGPCTITAAQAGNTDYAAAPDVARSFVIHAGVRPQTITFSQPAGTVVGRPIALSATATSRLPVSFRSDTRPVCTVSETTVTALAAGVCTITASQGGSVLFSAAQEVARSLEIQAGPQGQTITFGAPPAARAGARVPLAAAATSGLSVSFRSGTPALCTVSGTTVSAQAPGRCTIVASQDGSAVFAAAPDVAQTFQVMAGKAAQRITFAQPTGAGVGAAVTLTAAATSGLPVSFRADTPACAVSGATVIAVTAGLCTITATQGGSARYAAARDIARAFLVQAGRQPQTITLGLPPDAIVGVPVTPAATASSGLPVTLHSDTPAVCTVSGTTVTSRAPGTCTITAVQSGDRAYAAAGDVAQSLPVRAGQTPQTISFPPPAAGQVGTPVTLTASATSGLPVSFSSGTPALCTVSGATVTALTAGTCTIAATQGGSAGYAAAQDITRSFPVMAGHKSQTITFAVPPDAKIGLPVVLTAFASSGLPVTFHSATPVVCSVSGSTVSTLTAGTCTVTAAQGGSADYAAATGAARSFRVSPAGPKIPGVLIGSLAAAALAAAGGVLAVRRRRLRLRTRPTPGTAPSVRAAPHPGPPGSASVRTTGGAVAHTVRIQSDPGASTMTIKETQS